MPPGRRLPVRNGVFKLGTVSLVVKFHLKTRMLGWNPMMCGGGLNPTPLRAPAPQAGASAIALRPEA